MKSSLNHIYRTIWSEALNAWVAVSELTSAKGKRSGSSVLNAVLTASARNSANRNRRLRLKPIAVAMAYCFALNAAQANPIGAQVVNGAAAISQSGNLLTVTNSPNAIINWQGFSINTGETTRFIQQSASSAVLNRVLGADPSVLLGALTSNGKVFLVNPGGILVGQGARIDVAGFVASTLNLSNSDFLAGKLNFTSPLPRAGEGQGERASSIINQGNITTPEGGTVYLIAPQIENHGIITTPKGETILAAGNTVQLMDTGTPGVTVQVTGSGNSATNLGQILADSGRIGMVGAVVKNSGTISASSMVSEGGRVFLRATNRVEAGGTISANGTTGGTIQALGNQVGIMDGATVSANGTQGGGTVLIGGDFQGKNPDVPNAQVTYVAPTATISADGGVLPSPASGRGAGGEGNGGKIIVWADDTTRAYGNISARGGNKGGNGGFIETSGKQYLDVAGIKVSTAAPNGTTGKWLLDPTDIIILAGSGTEIWGTLSGGIFTPGASNSVVYAATINSNLSGGNVTISTSSVYGGVGDITFDASGGAVAINGAGTLLTLQADRDIKFTGGSTMFSGLNVSLIPAGKITTAFGSSVTLDSTIGPTRAYVALAKTWENYGTLSITSDAALHIEHNYGAGASTLHNMNGGIVNVAGTTGWAIWSNGCCQDGILINDGTFNVTASTAFEAAYSQSSSGTLNIANTKFLNLQNTIALSGGVNLNATGALNINENHGTAATLSNLTFSGTGGTLLVASGVNGTKTANLTNVSAINVALTVGGGGTINVLNGDAVFKTLSLSGGTFGAMTNGTLGITSGNFTIPNGVTYTGNVGYSAAGNLTVSSAIIIPGNVILRADSAGTGTGSITFAGGSIALSGGRADLYYNPAVFGTPDISASVTGGTLTAYMLVNDLSHLQSLNVNLAGNYALGKDVLASGATTPAINFSGQFDGLDHTITGLTSGLFGSIVVGAKVSNVGLVNSIVSGGSNVGAMARWNDGTISNSYVSGGSVTGTVGVGGLVGQNYGTISNSYVSGGSVTGTVGVGGLVGLNVGTISNSHVSGGGVTGTVDVGGLVGFNGGGAGGAGGAGSPGVPGTPGAAGSNALISDSYVTGVMVSGVSNVGGLAGLNIGGTGGAGGSGGISGAGGAGGAGGAATISNSYVSGGTVTGTSVIGINVGGLAGRNATGVAGPAGGAYGGAGGAAGAADIINTYVSGGSVASAGTDSGWVGGLVGYNSGTITTSYASTGAINPGGFYGFGGLVGKNTGTVTDSFWDIDTSGTLNGIDVGNTTGATGIHSSTLIVNAFTQATYTGFDFTSGTPVWWMSDTNTRPFLSMEHSATITNAHQLQLMAMNLSPNYTLGADINMGELTQASGMWDTTKGFVPVGISGTFDGLNHTNGLNHTISNLFIYRPTTDGVGLFGGMIASAVQNVGLIGANVTGRDSVGGLVGSGSGGTISNVYSISGSVHGNANVGGLVGVNGWDISNSYVDNSTSGSVSGVINVGGLVGLNDVGTTISTSHVSGGSVMGGSGNSVGGLVGYNNGTISNAYSTGSVSVSGGSDVGGLVGWNQGIISSSHVSSGTVAGVGSGAVGGLVGYNLLTGDISNSYVSGVAVSTLAPAPYGSNAVGGLVGFNLGTISNSYVSGGSVTGFWGVGGLVGNDSGVSTSGSYVSNVIVSGNTDVGGLAGYSNSNISNSYVSGGSVAGSYNVGGLVGYNWGIASTNVITGASIINSYVDSGSVSGNWSVGGLVGYNSGNIVSGSVINSSTVTATGVTPGYVGGLVGSNRGSIAGSSVNNGIVSASIANNVGGLVGYNSGSIDGSNVSSGTVTGLLNVGGLAGYNGSCDCSYLSAGSISNSYVDSGNVSGGNSVGGLVGANYYRSINNTHVSNSSVFASASAGGLVGLNYGAISNSSVSIVSIIGNTVVGGLAGYNSGSISSSYVSGGSVTGLMKVGGLVGNNAAAITSLGVCVSGGCISNSYVSGGTVSGMLDVGGLVGNNAGNVTNTYADAVTVSMSTLGSATNIGGLAGTNSGNISNSYVSGGTVGASTTSGYYAYNVGGLVGNNSGTISNTYVTGGTVTGYTGVAGLVGVNTVTGSINMSYAASGTVAGCCTNYGLVASNAGSIQDSFWDTQTTGAPNGVAAGGTIINVAGLLTADMMMMTSFSSWNISTPNTIANTGGVVGAVWRIYEGHTAPLLTSFMTGLTLTDAPDVTKTYNGAAQSGATTAIGGVLGAAATGTNAGFYNGYYSTQQGYDITGGNLTITAAALSAISLSGTRSYDGTVDVAASIFTLSGLVGSETLTLTGVGTIANKNVGTYTYSATLGSLALGSLALGDGTNGGLASNYTFTGGTQTAIITPLALTGSITAGSSTYGSALTPGTASLTNVVGTDAVIPGMVTVNTAGNTSASGNLNAGSYTGIQSVSALSGADAGNYTFAGVVGNYTVTPRPVTFTVDPGQGKTYGQFDPVFITFNDTAGVMQVVVNDTLMGGVTRAAGENAGIYAIGQGGLNNTNNPNYNITFVGNNFTINPALLSIVANPHTKVYGSADPLQSFIANGLMKNAALGIDDIAAAAAGTLFSGAMTRQSGENVGSYALALGTLSAGGNYTITGFISNILTITPAMVSQPADIVQTVTVLTTTLFTQPAPPPPPPPPPPPSVSNPIVTFGPVGGDIGGGTGTFGGEEGASPTETPGVTIKGDTKKDDEENGKADKGKLNAKLEKC